MYRRSKYKKASEIYKGKKNMLFPTLGKIATTDIVFIDINDSIQAAIKKMLSHGHRDIVVIGLKEYKIFTVEDILRARAKQIDF